jgi:non-ribosomal peptide synthase protein (TIGR01720 family)
VKSQLSAAETSRLLHEIAPAQQAQLADLLLAAWARTVSRWTASPHVSLHLEGHGREELFDDVDLSRTVGWFTAMFPFGIDLDGADTIEQAIHAVKDELRALPKHGIGYGLLAHLSSDGELRRQLAQRPQPAISFNYLGRFATSDEPAQARFALADEACGAARGALGERSHLLELSLAIVADELQVTLLYSENLHRQATVERLLHGFVDELRTMAAPDRPAMGAVLSPADFPRAKLSARDLRRLMSRPRGA